MQIFLKATFILFLVFAGTGVGAQVNTLSLVCDEWPPYQMRQESRVTGFSKSLIDIVLRRMNVRVEHISVYPWARAMHTLKTGRADALFSANYTKARTRFAHYPDEKLVHSPWVMWVRRADGLKFESFEDLKGKTVGVVRGYSYTEEFWQFLKTKGDFDEVTSDEQNFLKLAAGRVDYVLAELGNGLYIRQKLNLDEIIPLTQNPVKTDGLYVIFNKSRVPASFVDAFSRELSRLKQEPVYSILYNRFFKF